MSTIPVEVVYLIQKHIRPNPVYYTRLAGVSKSFYSVFTSDEAWKNLNPYGKQSSIMRSMYDVSTEDDLFFINVYSTGELHYVPERGFPPSAQRNNLFIILAMAVNSGDCPRVSSFHLMRCILELGYGFLLTKGSRHIRSNRELTLLAVKRYIDVLDVDSRFLKDREVAEALLPMGGEALIQHLPRQMQTDLEFMRKGIAMYPKWLVWGTNRMRSDPEFVKLAVDRIPSMITSTDLLNDFDMAMYMVSKQGQNLRYFPAFDSSPPIVRAAVTSDDAAIKYVNPDRLQQQHFLLPLVKLNPEIVAHLPDQLKDNRQVIMEAVTRDGLMIRHASRRLQNSNRKLVEAAVRQDGNALCYTPNFKSDRKIVAIAISQTPMALYFAAKNIQNDILFIMRTLWPNWRHWYDQWAKDLLEGNDREWEKMQYKVDFVHMPRREKHDSPLTMKEIRHQRNIYRAHPSIEKALILLRLTDSVAHSQPLEESHKRRNRYFMQSSLEYKKRARTR